MPLECLLNACWRGCGLRISVGQQCICRQQALRGLLRRAYLLVVEWNRLSSGLAHAAEESYAFRNAHEGVFHVLLVLQADGPRIVILAEQLDETWEVDDSPAHFSPLSQVLRNR